MTEKGRKKIPKTKKTLKKTAIRGGGKRKFSSLGPGPGLGPKNTKKCHPGLNGKTVDTGSCLTPEIILKLKEEYHKKYPNEKPLLGNSPTEIYKELSERFAESCKEEKCWIMNFFSENEIQNLYRPTSPVDWKKNPVEWLSNFDIEAVMHQYEQAYPEFEFLGSVPIDFNTRSKKGDDSTCISHDVCSFHLAETIKQGKTKIGIVFNLSPSSSSGSHWVSLFIHLPDVLMSKKTQKKTLKKSTKKAQIHGGGLKETIGSGNWNKETPYCFFFDSAGESPPNEIADLVQRLQSEWSSYISTTTSSSLKQKLSPEMFYDCNHRTGADHQKGNTECGVYSIFFLTTMLTGKCAGSGVSSEHCAISLETEQNKVDYFLGKNSNGSKIKIPDAFMENLRTSFFNPHE